MKRFTIMTSLIIILSLFIGCINFPVIASTYSVQYDKKTSYTYDDLDTLIELIAEQISNMGAAQKIIDGAKHLGYQNNHEIIQLAREEYNEASRIKQSYQIVYDDLMEHWHQKEEEYPVATYIWSYFKDLGYNNQVCAGILGNIMTEVGGNTLDIQAEIQTDTYYGICQWSKTYSDIWGASLKKQCDYLKDTIDYEINAFGYLYKKNFDYNDFLNLTNCESAALAFAKTYERCSSGSHSIRQDNAVIAYNYFVS